MTINTFLLAVAVGAVSSTVAAVALEFLRRPRRRRRSFHQWWADRQSAAELRRVVEIYIRERESA